MEWVRQTADWFAGNGRYHTLFQCMGGDTFWIGLTVVLDIAVAGGYCLIALHWARNQRGLPPIPAKRALGDLRNIFLFCGICGYLFIPIKMVWPAWRLYDMFMIALVYFTWRYAWGARGLKVVYNELGRTSRLAADLEKSQEESKRKSFFLNAISHDLRTPLNGLLLQANLAEIAATTSDADTLKGAVSDMKIQARAAAQLLDGFLEYARLEAGADPTKVEDVDVQAIVHGTVAAHNAAATEKGLFVKGHAPAGLMLRSDRMKLERILANLVGNAIKFTESGGVEIHAERRGGAVLIHVIDTGVGIAPADRERLFEEFFQAHNHERNRRKGFGLGLSIAKRLAEQLGGDITIESGVGTGSRFSLIVPQAAPPTPGRSATDIAAPPLIGAGT